MFYFEDTNANRIQFTVSFLVLQKIIINHKINHHTKIFQKRIIKKNRKFNLFCPSLFFLLLPAQDFDK